MRSNKPFQNTFEAKGIWNEGALRSFREGLARLHVFIVLANQGSKWLKFAGLYSVTVDHSIQSKHDFIFC